MNVLKKCSYEDRIKILRCCLGVLVGECEVCL